MSLNFEQKFTSWQLVRCETNVPFVRCILRNRRLEEIWVQERTKRTRRTRVSSSRALFSLAIVTSKHLLRRLSEVKDFRATTSQPAIPSCLLAPRRQLGTLRRKLSFEGCIPAQADLWPILIFSDNCLQLNLFHIEYSINPQVKIWFLRTGLNFRLLLRVVFTPSVTVRLKFASQAPSIQEPVQSKI